jgi:hypothetical protein
MLRARRLQTVCMSIRSSLVTLLLLLAIAAHADGISQGIGGADGISRGGSVGGGSGVSSSAAGACSQYTTFIARTSGTSGVEQAAYQAMICGMVTDGTWPLLDTFYIFATNTQTTALLNLVSASFAGTAHGTVAFTADHGYTGDGSTFYIDSGWKPTNGPNWATNSASFGVYVLTNSTSVVSNTAIGQDAITNFDVLLKPLTNLTIIGASGQINSASQPASAVSNANNQGSYVVSRTSSANFVVYKNQSSLGTVTNTSGAASAANVYIFANNGGVPGSFFTLQMSAAFTGGGLSGAQEAAVESRINAYMTALGINVY